MSARASRITHLLLEKNVMIQFKESWTSCHGLTNYNRILMFTQILLPVVPPGFVLLKRRKKPRLATHLSPRALTFVG